jgi:hypothetical protein
MTNKLTIQLLLIGDQNTGSTRLRVLRPLEWLADHVRPIISPDDQLLPGIDLLFVQKRADNISLRIMSEAVNAKIPVLFDIDDDQDSAQATAIKIADRVLVDTANRAQWIEHYTKVRPVVFEPCIDYLNAPPPRREGALTNGACTFGHWQSLFAAAPVMQAIGGRTWIGPLTATKMVLAASCGSLVPWSVEAMLREVPDHSICIVAYGTDGTRRCFNRVLLPAAFGVVPLVVDHGDSNARRLLERMGLPWLTCRNTREALEITGRLSDPREYDLTSKTVYHYVWNHHHPSHYANQLLQQMTEAANQRGKAK